MITHGRHDRNLAVSYSYFYTYIGLCKFSGVVKAEWIYIAINRDTSKLGEPVPVIVGLCNDGARILVRFPLPRLTSFEETLSLRGHGF